MTDSVLVMGDGPGWYLPDIVREIPQVLVLDSDPWCLDELRRVGQNHLINVSTAATAEEALALAARHEIEAALLELGSGHGPQRLQLIARLRAAADNPRLPVALVSDSTAFERRMAAASSGAALFLTKPVGANDFLRAVRLLCASQRQALPRVLVLESAAGNSEGIAARLADQPLEVEATREGRRMIDSLERLRPDLLLLDLGARPDDGLDLLRVVRGDLRWYSLPVLVLRWGTEASIRNRALEDGADDCLDRRIPGAELALQIRARLERTRLLRDAAERDELTGLLSRRAVVEAFASRLVEAERHRAVLSSCLIDMDRFKVINDRHGHLAGDRALATTGRLLAGGLRSSDLRGRWGGDEFLVIFPGEEAESSLGILTRISQELEETSFTVDGGEPFGISISAGVSGYPVDGVTSEQLVQAADRRLQAAKQLGRGRIVAVDG